MSDDLTGISRVLQAVLTAPQIDGRSRLAQVEITHLVPMLLADFAPWPTSTTALALRAGSGGDEPSIDGIYDVALERLQLAWSPGHARVILLFTDEPPQSYAGRSLRDVQAALQATRTTLVAVTDHPDAWAILGVSEPIRGVDISAVIGALSTVCGE